MPETEPMTVGELLQHTANAVTILSVVPAVIVALLTIAKNGTVGFSSASMFNT